MAMVATCGYMLDTVCIYYGSNNYFRVRISILDSRLRVAMVVQLALLVYLRLHCEHENEIGIQKLVEVPCALE